MKQTCIAGDAGKDDPGDAEWPSRAMECSIETSDKIREINVAIDVTIQTIEYTQIAQSCQEPE